MCEKRRKSSNWEPAGADMLPKPENCPNAIFEFYNKSKSDSVRSVDLKSNVKKHLLFSNWSIEYKSQENCSNKFRYLSPDRSKTYYSLNSLCIDLVESEPGAYSPLIEQPQSPIENLPLIPQDNQTCNILSSSFIETLSFTSLLTEQFEDFLSPVPQDGQTYNLSSSALAEQPVVHEDLTKSPIETPSSIPRFGQASLPTSPLFSSLFIEPRVFEYLKKSPMGPLYSVPQEELPMKFLSPIPHDGNSAIVPSGPLIEEKSKSTKPLACNSADIDPQYCPQAVVEYFNLGPSATRSQKGDGKLKDLREKVKKHMCSVGWEIVYVNKANKREPRYVSPRGRRYISLITACKGYLDEHGKFDQIPYASNAIKQAERLSPQKRPTPHHDSSYLALTYPAADDSRVSKKPRPPPPPPPLLPPPPLPPPPAAVAAPPSSRQNSRNLLARLIECKEVAVGAEVHYRGRDGRPMAEGHVSADGIKCNCCQQVMNLSNFEAHAGSTNHRPAANIFLKDGRSLQDCQLLLKPEEGRAQLTLKRDNNKVKCNQKNKKAKGNWDLRSNGYRCSVCHKLGALVLCYQCPSKFHTSCLGLREVPNGDWFCKSCEDQPTNEAESCPQAIVDYLLLGNILTRMDDNNKRLLDLRSKAKKHLCSIGWSFFHTNEGTKQELQYKSPSGRVYVSLIAACEGCVFEDG